MTQLGMENLNFETPIRNNDQVIPEDNRILWIRDRVLKCLGLGGHYHLFDDLISQNNRYYEGKLLNFLLLDTYGVTDLDRKIISFYKTYRNETIQEEMSVWEESHRTKITAIAAFTSKIRSYRLTKSAPGKVEKSEDESGKSKKIKKVKKGKGKTKSDTTDNSLTAIQSMTTIESDEGEAEIGSESGNHKVDVPAPSISKLQSKSTSFYESSSFTPPPGEEHKYLLTKKIVDKILQVPSLHIICGKLDSKMKDFEKNNILYFLRITENGLPHFVSKDECKNRILDYISFGTISGHYLTSFNRIVLQVFRPMVERHFQDPRTLQSREIEKLQQLYSENEIVAACSASFFVGSTNCARIRLMTIQTTDENYQSMSTCDEENENLVGRNINNIQISSTIECEIDISKSEEKRSETAVGSFKKDLINCFDALITAAQR